MEDKRFITFEKWFPVNCEYLRELATVTRVSPTARILFDTFSGICDKGNNIRTNYTELGVMLGLSRQAISRAVCVLEDFGFVSTSKCGTGFLISINPLVTKKTYASSVLKNSFYSGKRCEVPEYAKDKAVNIDKSNLSSGYIKPHKSSGKAKSLVNDIRNSILKGENINGK
jgi:hypothetical protein